MKQLFLVIFILLLTKPLFLYASDECDRTTVKGIVEIDIISQSNELFKIKLSVHSEARGEPLKHAILQVKGNKLVVPVDMAKSGQYYKGEFSGSQTMLHGAELYIHYGSPAGCSQLVREIIDITNKDKSRSPRLILLLSKPGQAGSYYSK